MRATAEVVSLLDEAVRDGAGQMLEAPCGGGRGPTSMAGLLHAHGDRGRSIGGWCVVTGITAKREAGVERRGCAVTGGAPALVNDKRVEPEK